jgi:hypothetical protein
VSTHAHEVKQNFDNHRLRLEMARQEPQQQHLMALEQLVSSSTPCSAVAAVEVLLRSSVARRNTNSSCCIAHELDSRQSSSVVALLLPAQQLWCKLVAPLMLVLQHPQHDCPILAQQAAASMLSYIACEPSEQQAVVLQQLQDHVQWLLSDVCSDMFPQLSGAAAAAVAHADEQLQLQHVLQDLLQANYAGEEAPDTAAAGFAAAEAAATAAAVAKVKQLLQHRHTRALLCYLSAQQLPALLQAAASNLDVAVAVFEITYQAQHTAALHRALREHAGHVLAAVHTAAQRLRDSNALLNLQLGHEKLGMLLAAAVTVRELLSEPPAFDHQQLLQRHLAAAVDCHLALTECSVFDFPGAALMWTYSMHWLLHGDTGMQQAPATPAAEAAAAISTRASTAAAAVSGAAAMLAQPQRMRRLASLGEQFLLPADNPGIWPSSVGSSSNRRRQDLQQLLQQVAIAAAAAGRTVPWLQLVVTALQDAIQKLQQLQQQIMMMPAGSQPAAAGAPDAQVLHSASYAAGVFLLELLDCLQPLGSYRQGLLALSQHVHVLQLCADAMLCWQNEAMQSAGSYHRRLTDGWGIDKSSWEASQQWAEETAAAAAAALKRTQQQHEQACLGLRSAIIDVAKVQTAWAQLLAADAECQQQQHHVADAECQQQQQRHVADAEFQQQRQQQRHVADAEFQQQRQQQRHVADAECQQQRQQQQQRAVVLQEVFAAVEQLAAASLRVVKLKALLQLASSATLSSH